jgi:hypothetical protein
LVTEWSSLCTQLQVCTNHVIIHYITVSCRLCCHIYPSRFQVLITETLCNVSQCQLLWYLLWFGLLTDLKMPPLLLCTSSLWQKHVIAGKFVAIDASATILELQDSAFLGIIMMMMIIIIINIDMKHKCMC